MASVEDMVVGVIKERHSENYKVDIGCASLATLSLFSFEGATKKNRPNLPVITLPFSFFLFFVSQR